MKNKRLTTKGEDIILILCFIDIILLCYINNIFINIIILLLYLFKAIIFLKYNKTFKK